MCWSIHSYTECVFERGEWKYELDLVCKSQHSKMRKLLGDMNIEFWYKKLELQKLIHSYSMKTSLEKK